jgi:hypothetical protein
VVVTVGCVSGRDRAIEQLTMFVCISGGGRGDGVVVTVVVAKIGGNGSSGHYCRRP